MFTRLTRSFAALAVVATAAVGLMASSAAQAQETTEVCVSSGFSDTLLIREISGFVANPYTDILPINIPAGPVEITSATSRDGYPNRVNVFQTSERWELEFLNAAGDVVARSIPTEDVPDYLAVASWTGPLGTVELPTSVVAIRGHFRPDINDDGSPNSVHATGVTLCWNQTAPVPSTVDCGEDTDGDAVEPNSDGTCDTTVDCGEDADGDAVEPNSDGTCDTTVDQPVTTEPVAPAGPTVTRDGDTNAIDVTTTITPVVEGSTTVAQDPKGPSTLPVTGTTTSSTVFAAMSLLAAGGAMLLASRSRLS